MKKQLTSRERFPALRFKCLIGALLFLVLNTSPGRTAEPTAQELLQGVRLNQGAQHRVLRGQLRYEGKESPLRLVLNGNEIRYEFTKP